MSRSSTLPSHGLAALALWVAGCFAHPEDRVADMVCKTDQNCPVGYTCVVPGVAGGCRNRWDAAPPNEYDAEGEPDTSGDGSEPDLALDLLPAGGRPEVKDSASEPASEVRDTDTDRTDGTRPDSADGPPDGRPDGLPDVRLDAPPEAKNDVWPETRRDDIPVKDDISSGAPAKLSMVPSTASYPETFVGYSSSAIELWVLNEGDLPSGPVRVTFVSPDFTITANECQDKVVPGQDGCKITVKLTPTRIGSVTASLEVSGEPGGKVSASLDGTGKAAPALSPMPRSLEFPTTVIGTASAPLTLTVTNTGTVPAGTSTPLQLVFAGELQFQIESTTCGTSLDVGASCEVRISFRPTTGGMLSGSLMISAAPGDQTFCPLKGMGTASGTTR